MRVEEVAERTGDRFSVGFVEDNEGNRWVVRLPTDQVAAAMQDQSIGLLRLLPGRLPYKVPAPAGFASVRDGRRAMVYPLIPGRLLSFPTMPASLATALGRAVAAIHNLDPAMYEAAGLPTYDAGDLHRRRQSDVDLGAATGLVPTGLLSRWEAMLDDVGWWRFSTRPVHGRLEADHVLVDFGDTDDAETGSITAITSWDNAVVGDPADDLAAVLLQANAETAQIVLQSYARSLAEPPDPALRRRATLLWELRLLGDLLTARRLENRKALTQATEALRRLDDAVGDEDTHGNRSGTFIDTVPVDYAPEAFSGNLYRAGSAPSNPLGSSEQTGEQHQAEASPRPEPSERDGDQVPPTP